MTSTLTSGYKLTLNEVFKEKEAAERRTSVCGPEVDVTSMCRGGDVLRELMDDDLDNDNS